MMDEALPRPAAAAASRRSRTGITGESPAAPGAPLILTAAAASFIERLERKFGPRRRSLLDDRNERQLRIDAGEFPRFLPETEEIRRSAWVTAPPAQDLRDRRVEITGPAGDAKMVINALNSGASVFMADFEDAQSPTWENVIGGQLNLHKAIRRTLSHTAPGGKEYALGERTAVLMMRPRGWHLPEKHFIVDGAPVSASLFDAGLYLFHNARELVARGSQPSLYLPKLEHYAEARLWNDVFDHAEAELGLGRGTIRATVLIETILAAFQMDEILYELREHSAGLNCGRWDYIFSFIKKFRAHPSFLLPERAVITMEKGFLAAYVGALIRTCHRRRTHAMGGMAAQIPIRDDPAANRAAFAKVRADKEREVRAGHDGTWVAHPGLVPAAREVFDALMPEEAQFGAPGNAATPEQLLAVPPGPRTSAGVRTNIDVGIRYLAAWLGGSGAVPLYHLMEDAATAEICRAQIWQWLRHRAPLDDGGEVTPELVGGLIDETARALGDAGAARRAAGLFRELVFAPVFPDFLTIPAYNEL